jgi:hypothetical protein
MKDACTKNYSLYERKQRYNKWKEITCSWNKRNNISKIQLFKILNDIFIEIMTKY